MISLTHEIGNGPLQTIIYAPLLTPLSSFVFWYLFGLSGWYLFLYG